MSVGVVEEVDGIRCMHSMHALLALLMALFFINTLE